MKTGENVTVALQRVGDLRVTEEVLEEELKRMGIDDTVSDKGWTMVEYVTGIYHNPGYWTGEIARALVVLTATTQVAERKFDEAIKLGKLDISLLQEMFDEELPGLEDYRVGNSFNVLRRTAPNEGGAEFQPFGGAGVLLTSFSNCDFFYVTECLLKLKPEV